MSAGDYVLYFSVSIIASIIGGVITAHLVKKAIDEGLRKQTKGLFGIGGL